MIINLSLLFYFLFLIQASNTKKKASNINKHVNKIDKNELSKLVKAGLGCACSDSDFLCITQCIQGRILTQAQEHIDCSVACQAGGGDVSGCLLNCQSSFYSKITEPVNAELTPTDINQTEKTSQTEETSETSTDGEKEEESKTEEEHSTEEASPTEEPTSVEETSSAGETSSDDEPTKTTESTSTDEETETKSTKVNTETLTPNNKLNNDEPEFDIGSLISGTTYCNVNHFLLIVNFSLLSCFLWQ
ncbi:hypothetical protein K502DRAFT_323124 [Neoconidiobolus thromboides FSU 785]|nr:hypothetical protein K502DRAFT_323124 [Neoconidiobolus thromboides FSU 785]